MKCEQGDIAKIIMSLRPQNIGKTVLVENYIGHFNKVKNLIFAALYVRHKLRIIIGGLVPTTDSKIC